MLHNKRLPILVIDDDVNGNEALCEHLRFRGYRAMSIHSGAQAVEFLKKMTMDELPSVILLDVLMPGMNGCEVLNEIRSHPETKHIPVIMLSVLSKDEVQDHLTCICSGYNAYVSKPFDMDQLIGQLQGLTHD